MKARVNVVFYWNSRLPGALNFIFANFLDLIMEYFIGIDIGTTNAKAVAMTAAGKILGEERAAYPSIQKLPGQFEQDPEKIFKAIMSMIPRLVTKLKSHEVTAIGLSSAMHGLIAVDKKGKPITNLITWADTRSASYAQDLRTTDLGKKIFFETGTPIHAMSPLSKLIWMRNELPKIWNSAGKFISMKEYFLYRLFGKFLVDYSIASATGLFNIMAKKWDSLALHEAGIEPDRLSIPVPVLHVETGISSAHAKTLRIGQKIPFVIGASDGCLANLGTGAMEDHEAAVTIGTSGALRMVSRKPVHDPDAVLFNYILDDEFYVSGGPINNGGVILRWIAENMLGNKFSTIADVGKFVKTAMKAPIGSGKLILLPYLLGERAPVWDGEAKGAYVGLTTEHRQSHLMRAGIEGISFALLQILNALEAGEGKVKRVYASGGYLQSRPWLQLLANIFNKEILHVSVADASAIGACMMAMRATGHIKSWKEGKDFLPPPKIYNPDGLLHKKYQPYFEVYKSLYEKLKDSFHELNKIADR